MVGKVDLEPQRPASKGFGWEEVVENSGLLLRLHRLAVDSRAEVLYGVGKVHGVPEQKSLVVSVWKKRLFSNDVFYSWIFFSRFFCLEKFIFNEYILLLKVVGV